MIKETKNYKMIRKMLVEDKELFDRISDDYTDIKKWNPEKPMWLGWFDNGKCKALLSVHEENAIILIIHMHIPLEYRGKNSFKMGNGLIKYLIKHCDKRFVKINIKIPDIYHNVVKFAEKCGFQIEGLDRKSFIKNGNIYDRIILGKIIR